LVTTESLDAEAMTGPDGSPWRSDGCSVKEDVMQVWHGTGQVAS